MGCVGRKKYRIAGIERAVRGMVGGTFSFVVVGSGWAWTTRPPALRHKRYYVAGGAQGETFLTHQGPEPAYRAACSATDPVYMHVRGNQGRDIRTGMPLKRGG